MHGSLSIARQIAQNFLVVLVSQTISSSVGRKVHEVDVRVLLLNIIALEGEVVRLVDHQREVFILQVLSSDLGTTGVRGHRDFRLFHDTDRIAHLRDFTKVFAVGDIRHDVLLAESKLDFFGIDYRAKSTVRQVAITCSRGKRHNRFSLCYGYKLHHKW